MLKVGVIETVEFVFGLGVAFVEAFDKFDHHLSLQRHGWCDYFFIVGVDNSKFGKLLKDFYRAGGGRWTLGHRTRS